MRIQVRMEGGFAQIPGLSAPKTLDSATLSAQDANEMRQLVQGANFFELPAVLNKPAPGAADYRTYHITIEDNDRYHTIQVSDPINDPRLQALLTFIQQHIL